ncbi:MAG: purine-binding chemotaxis protein CheW [Spirochaetales bacterium]|nr:purine-binding chemotaxis protein CheW [Spirochaetales bacterium]
MEKTGVMQVVTFQLGQEIYAIDIMDVKRIVGKREVREIPNAPPYVEGILNLRGQVTPIINLHKRFYFDSADLGEDEELLSGYVILQISEMILGIMIDKILRVVTIDAKHIQPPPQMISGIGVEYIDGVVNDEGSYIIILDIRKLFNPKELHQLTVMQK